MEFTAVMLALKIACSQGAFGNTCDKDVNCMGWDAMYFCHEKFFGDIHTPPYMDAIRTGRNAPRGKFRRSPENVTEFVVDAAKNHVEVDR